MANPFLEGSSHEDIETAILYEKARILDIGNAVAYTDGDRLYVNTDDNLAKILPDYNKGMLKWLLWHEEYHMRLKHHNRFFKYLKELSAKETEDKFQVTKDEVNIIMDILVHDSLAKMFPELVETAMNNFAQMRNNNSLGYDFKTHNLEDMLDEYRKFKHKDETDGSGDDSKEDDSKEDETEDGDDKSKSKSKGGDGTDEKEKGKKKDSDKKSKKKGHADGGDGDDTKDTAKEDGEPDIIDDAERPEESPASEHKRDWSGLDKIDTKEFIERSEADRYDAEINRLKNKKIKLGRLTHALNGLATTKRDRTYRLPSMLQMGDGCIFKGKTPGRVELYLIFDASGSMSSEMATFKDIISRSIPQAMNCPCEWFAGAGARIKPYKTDGYYDDGYFKGKFKDFVPVRASSGFSDDGDRTIELCYEAEQKGFSPIGVTDGGGCISWSKKQLKQLRRTILVGPNGYWLEEAKKINSNIQTLEIDI